MSEQESHKQLAAKIKESARQIWLAGLGAYTKAEEDAGKVFEKLVSEGEDIERKTRGVFEKQIRAVEDRVEGVKDKANHTWDKLESVFDQRVSHALQRLGIPTRSELEELRERIAELEGADGNPKEKVESRKKKSSRPRS
ncbi:MAG: phasin family protein [Hahellaceae bacterium]|nr:phasin family protein [Hahellaceae bacterium]